MKRTRFLGAVEASASDTSYSDSTAAYMDLDAGLTYAQFGAKYGAGGSMGVKLRTVNAGTPVDALTLSAAGAATFVGTVTATGFTGPLTGNASTATALATARSIYGANFDGTAALPGPVGAAYGGTGVANNAANTLTFTGAYSLGLTLTANTAVTLPTSGTLVNSAVTTLSSLTTIGTLVAGAVPASLVTAGTFGPGDFEVAGHFAAHSLGSATLVNVLFNSYGVALDNAGADNAAAWAALLAAVPAGTILYFPKGTYHNATAGGFILTKCLHIVGEGSGWYNGTNVQDATLFVDTISLNAQTGSSVRHVAIDARNVTSPGSGGVSSGAAATTSGHFVVDDLLYVGSGATAPDHGVLMQSGPFNVVTNVRAYGAYHAVAVRASVTRVSGIVAVDCTDITVKSDTGSGTVHDVLISDVACSSWQTATCAQLSIAADASGIYTYNVTVQGVTFASTRYPLALNPENGGQIMDVVIANVTSYLAVDCISIFTATSGTVQNCTFSGGVFLNASGVPLNNSLPGVNIQLVGVAVNGVMQPQAVVSATVLKLGNAYTAGAPAATGYVTLQDSTGTIYKVLVGT